VALTVAIALPGKALVVPEQVRLPNWQEGAGKPGAGRSRPGPTLLDPLDPVGRRTPSRLTQRTLSKETIHSLPVYDNSPVRLRALLFLTPSDCLPSHNLQILRPNRHVAISTLS
jgi:hypothetical protein